MPIVLSLPVPCEAGGRHFGNAYALRDRREIIHLQRQLVVSARLAAVGDLSAAISQSISEPVARLRDEVDSAVARQAQARTEARTIVEALAPHVGPFCAGFARAPFERPFAIAGSRDINSIYNAV